nr:hypothetical protein [Tanacetum cinerariifolium]
MEFPAMVPDESIDKTKPLPKGPNEDKTQSTRFEVSVPNQHQGKTSSKVEPDKTLLLTTVADIQALLIDFKNDLKKDSEDDVFEAREEMDKDIQEPATKETQTHHFTETLNEEPLLPNRDQPKSFHAKKTDESDSASLCSETLKPYDNYMLITERKLHEEAAASYVDLRATAEDYYEENINHRTQTDTMKEPEFNQRLLKAAEGYIQNSNRLNEIGNSLKAINFPSFQARIAAVEHTQVIVWKKPPSYTKGEQFLNVKKTKEAATKDVEMEPEHQYQVSRPIPITIVRPIIQLNHELKMIGSLSRIQLTDTILEVPIPQPSSPVIDITLPEQPESLPTAPRADKGKIKFTNEVKKMYQLTKDEIQAHLDKEEKLEQAAKEARISKPELIKVFNKKPPRQNKKNKIVGKMMTSMGKRYDRLKKIPEELRIQSALPTPAQAPSQITSGKKRKH